MHPLVCLGHSGALSVMYPVRLVTKRHGMSLCRLASSLGRAGSHVHLDIPINDASGYLLLAQMPATQYQAIIGERNFQSTIPRLIA